MLAVLVIATGACGSSVSPSAPVVAAGTTVVDNGVVKYLVEASPGLGAARVVAATSAEALELLQQGAADLAIVHAPDRLAAFTQRHEDASTGTLFATRFVLVGPPETASAYDGLTAPEVFAAIARDGAPFVTRADGSGTYESEIGVWAASGIDPAGAPWLITTGQGMGFTLQVAVVRKAFVWVEEGTLAASSLAETLRIVQIADAGRYDNVYTAVWLVDTSDRLADFIEWVGSDAGTAAINAMNSSLFGRGVVVPPTE